MPTHDKRFSKILIIPLSFLFDKGNVEKMLNHLSNAFQEVRTIVSGFSPLTQTVIKDAFAGTQMHLWIPPHIKAEKTASVKMPRIFLAAQNNCVVVIFPVAQDCKEIPLSYISKVQREKKALSVRDKKGAVILHYLPFFFMGHLALFHFVRTVWCCYCCWWLFRCCCLLDDGVVSLLVQSRFTSERRLQKVQWIMQVVKFSNIFLTFLRPEIPRSCWTGPFSRGPW